MINKLLIYYKNELSFKAIVKKKRKSSEKVFFYFIALYITPLALALFLSTVQGYAKYLSLLFLILFVVDIILFIKSNKGILHWYLKKIDEINLDVLNKYKKVYKIEFDSIEQGLFLIRKKKLNRFFKQQNIKKDYNFILSSLRHKENIELTIIVILFSAVMITIVSFFNNILEFYLPIENLKEIYTQIKNTEATELEKEKLYTKIFYLMFVISLIITFVKVFPYLFAKGFFEMRFMKLKNLQTLIERLHRANAFKL